jgi:O-antigen/teichoic acid export membrane protein
MKITGIINKITELKNRSELSQRFFKGISWSLIGSIGGKMLQLIAFMIVARIVGKEDYGKIGIVRSTITMFMIFSTFGLSSTATRYISMYRNINPGKAISVYRFASRGTLLFGLIISGVILLFSQIIAVESMQDITLQHTLQIGAISLLFLSLTATQNGVLNGFEDFRSVGIGSVFNGVVQFILTLAGTLFWGINGAIAGMALSAFVYWIQLQFAVRPNLHKLYDYSKNTTDSSGLFSVFIKFSLPSLLASITVIPVIWWTKTKLIEYSGYEEMATFDVAEQWYYTLLFIPNALSGILLPLLTNTAVEGTDNQYKKLIKVNLYLNVVITLVLATGTGILAPAINKLYGKDFTNYLPMIIMLITAVFCAANNVLGQVIASKGRMWSGFALNSLWAAWLILFTYIFVVKLNLGAVGLSYAMLVSYILHSVTQSFVALRWKSKM